MLKVRQDIHLLCPSKYLSNGYSFLNLSFEREQRLASLWTYLQCTYQLINWACNICYFSVWFSWQGKRGQIGQALIKLFFTHTDFITTMKNDRLSSSVINLMLQINSKWHLMKKERTQINETTNHDIIMLGHLSLLNQIIAYYWLLILSTNWKETLNASGCTQEADQRGQRLRNSQTTTTKVYAKPSKKHSIIKTVTTNPGSP